MRHNLQFSLNAAGNRAVVENLCVARKEGIRRLLGIALCVFHRPLVAAVVTASALGAEEGGAEVMLCWFTPLGGEGNDVLGFWEFWCVHNGIWISKRAMYVSENIRHFRN